MISPPLAMASVSTSWPSQPCYSCKTAGKPRAAIASALTAGGNLNGVTLAYTLLYSRWCTFRALGGTHRSQVHAGRDTPGDGVRHVRHRVLADLLADRGHRPADPRRVALLAGLGPR